MSAKVEIVKIDEIQQHENADRLEIAKIGEYPCIVKRGEFKSGDSVIYIPEDFEVPTDNELFSFLKPKKSKKNHVRIKAKKLRGIFSMGLIIKIPEYIDVEKDIAEQLNIRKYETPIEKEDLRASSGFDFNYEIIPGYDIENLRKYPNIFESDEKIIVTEKLHGTNASFCYSTKFEKFLVKSRKKYRLYDEDDVYWKIAERYNLEEICKKCPNYVFYGEIFGNIQELKYGLHDQIEFRLFDVHILDSREFLDAQYLFDYGPFQAFSNIPKVPVLYRGPYKSFDFIKQFAEGNSTFTDDHVREGIVIKPSTEKWNQKIGRKVLKLHGEGYLLK